jgi:hypothetical protein
VKGYNAGLAAEAVCLVYDLKVITIDLNDMIFEASLEAIPGIYPVESYLVTLVIYIVG